MSTEENKALWRRWVEEMNKGKAAALAVMARCWGLVIKPKSGCYFSRR